MSARHLYDIVKSLPEQQVTLKRAHNNYLEVKSGPSEFRIVGLPAEDFPALPRFEKVPFTDVEPGGPARHDRADLLRRLDRRDPLQPERRLLRAVGARRSASSRPTATGSRSPSAPMGGDLRPEARRDPAEEGAPGAPQAARRGGRVRGRGERRRASASSRTAPSSAGRAWSSRCGSSRGSSPTTGR